MTTITQQNIDRINALYKDPETGKGILDGWKMIGVGRKFLAAPAGSDSFAAITRLVHKLLEQEQRSGVWILDVWREIRATEKCECPNCGQSHDPTGQMGERVKADDCGWEKWGILSNRYMWLAHPPVVEPEPEWEVTPVTETTDEAIVKFYGDSVSATCLKCDGSGCAHEKAVMDKELQEHKSGTHYWDETYVVTRKQQSKEQA